MDSRRDFLIKMAASSAVGFAGCTRPPKPLFEISLAEWSLNRTLFSGEMDHLDDGDTS